MYLETRLKWFDVQVISGPASDNSMRAIRRTMSKMRVLFLVSLSNTRVERYTHKAPTTKTPERPTFWALETGKLQTTGMGMIRIIASVTMFGIWSP